MSRWVGLGVLIFALAGCGSDSGDGRSDESEAGVRATALAYVDALAAKRYDDACAVLTPAAQGQISSSGRPDGCRAGLARVVAAISQRQLTNLRKAAQKVTIAVNGTTASSAPVPGGSSSGGQYRYIRGKWYLADDQGQ